jgi:hypothetical protein
VQLSTIARMWVVIKKLLRNHRRKREREREREKRERERERESI